MRDFTKSVHNFTAAEWEHFGLLLAPIYLKDVLPEYDYQEYINLVDIVIITKLPSLNQSQVSELEDRIIRFYEYYEERFYGGSWRRLHACLPVFHMLLHVAWGIRVAGPMGTYDQWSLERILGLLTWHVSSRVEVNRNLELNLLISEQRNMLRFVMPGTRAEDGGDDAFEDADGEFVLYKFLIKQLADRQKVNNGTDFVGIVDHEAESDEEVHVAGVQEYERGAIVRFCGPSHRHLLSMQEKKLLRAFLTATELNGTARREELPILRCIQFQACVFLMKKRMTFRSGAIMGQRDNLKRTTSYVRLERHGDSFVGQVMRYITVQIGDGARPIELDSSPAREIQASQGGMIRKAWPDELLLCIVKTYGVSWDGRLMRLNRKAGSTILTYASTIKELIGVVQKGEEEYIIHSGGALWRTEREEMAANGGLNREWSVETGQEDMDGSYGNTIVVKQPDVFDGATMDEDDNGKRAGDEENLFSNDTDVDLDDANEVDEGEVSEVESKESHMEYDGDNEEEDEGE